MKARKARSTHSNSSLGSLDCSCQILYDSDLSQVSDTQCCCDQCLQAKLEAFNDFNHTSKVATKITHQHNNKTATGDKKGKQNLRSNRSLNNMANSKRTHEDSKNQRTGHQISRSPNQFRKTQGQTGTYGKLVQSDLQGQQLNDFVLITKNRTRQFLRELKKKENLKKEDQKLYRQKILHNLEMLRYATKITKDREKKQGQKIPDKPVTHQYKWNHSLFPLCYEKHRHTGQQCCAFPNPDRLKKSLDTNLNAVIPSFQDKRAEILQEAKKKRVQKFQPSKQKCTYDHCQNHHMRTSKTKLAQIERFISEQANLYKKKKKKQRQQSQNQKKIKEAKLRAINLKCQQILIKSKKRPIDEDRTSFHLTIDNFDTFSQLRDANQQRKIQRQNVKKVKHIANNGPGQTQKAIYEDDFEDEDQLPKRHKQQRKMAAKIGKPGAIDKAVLDNKILKDARIYSPKRIKDDDEKEKLKKTIKNEKRTLNMAKLKDEEKRKEKLERQIANKKAQIMKQFNKRSSNACNQQNKQVSRNKKIRQEYEQKLKEPKLKSKAQSYFEQEKPTKDAFRTVYKHLGSNEIEVEAGGDPLMQQYLYHEQLNKKNAAEYRGQKQLFSANLQTLISKKKLEI